MNKEWMVAKLNFRNSKLTYIITGIIIASLFVQDIVYIVMSWFNAYPGKESSNVSISNFFYLLIILGAIFIPIQNFQKMMNLGSKRIDFFKGCFLNYLIASASISLLVIILFYTYDKFTIKYYYDKLNLLNVFGWLDSGPIVAFFQQFAFLLLLAIFIHTLVSAQDKWYGWVADLTIGVIISVFTPIAPLRNALATFFYIIIFSHPLIQIFSCLILSIGIYMINLPIYKRKKV